MSEVRSPHDQKSFRTFLVVWATQSFSVLGTALTFFALTIWLTQVLYAGPDQQAELAFGLAALTLAFALPNVLIAPIAGAWADRYDRKRVMVLMSFINAVLALGLVFLLASGQATLWSVIGIFGFLAIFAAFHQAAFDASYVMIVPEKQLARANGMMQTMWALSGIVAPAAAAFIISVPALARQGYVPGALGELLGGMPHGAALAIGVDMLSYVVAASALLFLHIPSPKRADLGEGGKAKRSLWADVKEGGLFIWRRPSLLWLLLSFTAANFVLTSIALVQPLLIRFNLAADWAARGFTLESALALLASVGSLGGVVGGFLISAWGGLKSKRVYGVLVPLVLAGAAQIMLGLSSLLYLTAAMAFLVMAMGPIANAHSQTIWQTQTPPELQGRVFSVRRLLAQITWPLSTVIVGWAGGLFNPGIILAVMGAVMALFVGLQFFNPTVLRVEEALPEARARVSVGD